MTDHVLAWLFYGLLAVSLSRRIVNWLDWVVTKAKKRKKARHG